VNPTPLLIDNIFAIQLANNLKFHDQTKHINTKYHLIKHHAKVKIIKVKYCPTDEQITNILTKALGREKFKKFKKMQGLTNSLMD